ncbi:MAG TPA: UDP-N-acetylmuramoyl-L-alanyl-D-glutamate--2,6-diaminopimelate ligase [Bryobacteraceae bacterium]|jgi:UDP-N-acetylmuramoyl-L-alanyl-D-glutamate--2,6-diaminopimelate ligase|nr:UDP-N-acetylmuramoyl-L-alanyl-D-glutamate--2,6-diaminopimelate ligase [Bryobacteraceae bacterium]
MTIGQVLNGVKLAAELAPGLAQKTVGGLEYDSRRVGKDFLFFAFPGSRVDGARFAADALRRGAAAVVSELPRPDDFAGAWIQVDHGRQALARAALNFYEHPDRRVAFTGVTGTNGKTTTSYLIDAILRQAGFVTGLIGTIEYRIAGEARPAPNTTPESLDVIRMASELETRGGRQFIMEVSSHALALGRVFGIQFHTAVFTNLTRDHLDFHRSMEEYAAAKRLLFSPVGSPPPQWAVLNADDAASRGMTGAAKTLWYGAESQIRAEGVRGDFSGLHFELVFEGARQSIESRLNGRINVMNILAAAGAALSYGLNLETIAKGVAACRAVPGRFETIDEGQPFGVVVDYAHTDDALRNVIQVARELARGRVITLFGCGGDRDRSKRPLMGMAAAELSDFVVLTSDNPRSEDPLDIMNDAMVGIRRYDTPHVAEPDREKAIRIAIGEAKPGDVVLLAGKGHETYQVLKDRTIHFDDRETARAVLRELDGSGKSE